MPALTGHTSRRAAFLHRALAGSQAVSTFGAWAAHSASIRAAVPPVTCLFRRCVRGMLWYRPFLPAGSLPSTLSAAAPQLCSNASSVVWTRPTPRAFRGSFVSSTSCRGPSALVTSGDTRSPRFRRDPFVRDVALDHGRATVPRVAAPHMLPSTVATVSAPASSRFSRLNPTPHTITVYASPWSSPSTAQHSFPGRCYPLPGPDFHRLDPASFAWRTATPSPWGTFTSYSLPVLIGAPEVMNDASETATAREGAIIVARCMAYFLFKSVRRNE